MEKIRTSFKTLSILLLVNLIPCNGLPQRSIQLGGTGPRPVALGAQPAQTGPSFSQQLAFGQAPTIQQLQYQQTQQQQQQVGRVRIHQQQQTQQQQPQQQQQQIYLQQGPGTSGAFPPIGSFPIPANIRQPVVLRSPVATTTAASEEEYEDEEYSEEQPQQALVRTQPTQRPTRPVVVTQQRNAVRVTPAAAQPGPGPQRFIIPQQQQQQAAAPVQGRRPIARPTAPAPSASQEVRTPVNTYQARPAYGQDSRLLLADGTDRLAPTPEPVKTLNRYMNKNDDGSTSWGYTNEDGSFKEETIGVDCVVRGKYGYVDPDGVKREFEYQTGNPCDPNKRGQQQEEEEEDDERQQQPLRFASGGRVSAERLGGLLNARPLQQQQQQPQQLPQFRQAQRFAVQQQ